MKIVTEQVEFRPITITIESQEELDALFGIARYTMDNSTSQSTAEGHADLWLDALNQFADSQDFRLYK